MSMKVRLLGLLVLLSVVGLRVCRGYLIVPSLKNGTVSWSESRTINVIKWGTLDVPPYGYNTTHRLIHYHALMDDNNTVWVLYDGPTRARGDLHPDLVRFLRAVEDSSVIGVLVKDQKISPGYIALMTRSKQSFKIPFGIMGSKASFPNDVSTTGTDIKFMGWDENEWSANSTGNIIWFFLMIVPLLCAIVWSVFMLIVWFSLQKQFQISIITCCLMFEVAANSIKGTAIVFHFLLSYVQVDYPIFLDTFYFPFCLTSCLFIVFFWLDLTSGSLYSGKFLDKMKIPALIGTIIVFTAEILVDILAQVLIYINIQIVMIFIYIVLYTALGIFFIITGYMIIKTQHNNEKFKKLKNVTIKITVIGFLCFTTAGIAIGLFLGSERYASYVSLWSMIFTLTSAISLLQISMFKPNKKQKKKNTSTSSSISKKTSQSTL